MARKNRTTPGTPDAVKDAAAKADKLHEEIYGKKEPATKEVVESEEPAPAKEMTGEGADPQPVEPAAKPDSSGDTPTPTPPPTAPMNGAAPQAASAPAPEPKPEPDWEQRYKALQGKYNAEVPRMAEQIRTLEAQMRNLAQAQTKPEEPKPDKKIVSDEEIEDYGEDLIDLIRRVAKSEVSGVEQSLKPKIDQIYGRVEQTSAQAASEKVYGQLDREVQNWREINKSAEFLSWLAQSDPYAGDLRKNLLADAFKRGDAARVVAFFKGFSAEHNLVAPQPTPAQAPAAPAPTPEQPAQRAQVSLEEMAGPGAGPTTPVVPTESPQAQQWTRAQVAKFYKDVNSGVFANNPTRKAQIEASIARALRENRVH